MDRNKKMFDQIMQGDPSLSARRAWIEIISALVYPAMARAVALRKESVDRNPTSDKVPPDNAASLSARRAWIEIAD